MKEASEISKINQGAQGTDQKKKLRPKFHQWDDQRGALHELTHLQPAATSCNQLRVKAKYLHPTIPTLTSNVEENVYRKRNMLFGFECNSSWMIACTFFHRYINLSQNQGAATAWSVDDPAGALVLICELVVSPTAHVATPGGSSINNQNT